MAKMKDVAELAGVDKGTVSRVIKGDPRISDLTAQRVWEAVHKLGYRPDRLASGLAAGRWDLCGLVIQDQFGWWVGPFLDGFARGLSAKGNSVLVLGGGWGRGPCDELVGRKVDGVLWMGDVPSSSVGLSDLPFPVLRWGDVEGDCGASIGFHQDLLVEALHEAVGPFRYVGGRWSPFSFLEGRQDPDGRALVWDGTVRWDPVPPGVSVVLGPFPGMPCPRVWTVPLNPREVGLVCGRALGRLIKAPRARMSIRLEVRPSAPEPLG
ncbi:transcriptional regulator [Thermanaerovibrio velox DSM 12556]|uniref:Transcriptional regulator n=2 Tax=Thermanaerovibrio TaxID=81461 RepID=H0UNK0_9BACT|nr:transcriptional regulator [Thermanaerovibrio velox DSM 12556]